MLLDFPFLLLDLIVCLKPQSLEAQWDISNIHSPVPSLTSNFKLIFSYP